MTNASYKNNIEDIYPLSPMQEGMLFHSVYAPNSGVYVEVLSCRIEGNLNIEAFKQTWQLVINTFSTLRTAFLWQREQPLQVILREVSLPFSFHDWRQRSPKAQQQSLIELKKHEKLTGFDFEKAPLMRLHLIEFGANQYQLVLANHHILFDGWSMPLIFADFFSTYKALANHQPTHSHTTQPYRNYIKWLQKQNSNSAQTFWHQYLAGFETPNVLGIQKASVNHNQADSQGTQTFSLPPDKTAALKLFTKCHRLTINNLVQAAWAILLSRYTGETDIIFGITISGRPVDLVGIESMVGLFINTLPIRIKIAPETLLIDWLKEFPAQQIQIESYGYIPLVEIQRQSQISNGRALFESIVVFENYPISDSLIQQESSFEVKDILVDEQNNYPLTITAGCSESLSISIKYSEAFFDKEKIERLCSHFHTLLENIIDYSEQPIPNLPMLSETERYQQLVEWNNTQAEYSSDKCIHQLFEEQVEKTPDMIALVFKEQRLSYQELNKRANQLAHYLQSLGVKSETLVGICIERSVEMVVSLLAILKAGGAYVPLDPNYPSERLQFMLNDADIDILLTREHLIEQLSLEGKQTVYIDSEKSRHISKFSTKNCNDIGHDHLHSLAYVIYTSGSTGTPKGVMIEHQSLTNLLEEIAQLNPLNARDSFLAVTTLSFDIAALELFLPLISGAQLIVVQSSVAKEGNQLRQALEQLRPTVMQATPATWQMLFAASWQRPDELKIFCGGEAPGQTLVQKLVGDNQSFWHMYGPTETTIWSTFSHVTSDNLPISIGNPIGNTQVYILNKHLQPLPIGVSGELYIGGRGIARGYLNRPELNAERFIKNPFGEGNLYRTGDNVRYLANGNIEYLGRLDHQVKVRGFRIELGEIETVLSNMLKIQHCVVVMRKDKFENQHLVAYIVTDSIKSDKSVIANIRFSLKQNLPDYMVPSAVVALEALPLTPNGKIDRNSLPTLDISSQVSQDYVEPRDTLEEELVFIWEDVLDVEPIGIYDNFFELGGHSLLTLPLVNKIRHHLNLELSITDLFQTLSIAKLAETLRHSNNELPWSPLIPIKTIGTQLPLFCFPGISGNPMYFRILAKAMNSDRPIYGLQAPGSVGSSTQAFSTIEESATYYIKNIKTIQPHGPYFLCGHSAGGCIAFEVALQLQQLGEEVVFLGILDSLLSKDQHQDFPLDSQIELLIELEQDIVEKYNKEIGISLEELQSLSIQGQVTYFKKKLEIADVTIPFFDMEQLESFLKFRKIAGEAIAKYHPKTCFDRTITYFSANDEKDNVDKSKAWQKFSSQTINNYNISGNHSTIMDSPNVQILAREIDKLIGRESVNNL